MAQDESPLPTIAVLVVNFRTPVLTEKAVQSALCESVTSEVIVVDNDSGDGSSQLLEDAFKNEPRVSIISSKRNLGFGAGNNMAAKCTNAELLFLLNSDAEIRRGSLETLAGKWTKTPNAGILAPTIFVAATGDVQTDATGVFPTAKRIILQTSKRIPHRTEPDFVSGCALLISSQIFKIIGGFDEDIFMYFEDVLLSWQVRKMGLRVTVCPDAAVDHRGGASYRSGLAQKRDYYRAQDLFLEKIGDPAWTRMAVKFLRWPIYAFRALGRNIKFHSFLTRISI